ncbi:MAG: hypothetical protein QF662_02230, partial [Phycisphaerae bacterium]|nr:hypothetical protein [Phycisphaerae bacterium]
QNHAKLVNGDLGTIIRIAREDWEGHGPAWVEVEFDRVGERRLPRYKWEKKKWTKNREEVVFAVQQFPLIPAYGLTVHKAQGMSLDLVNVDGRKVNFAAGQVYVALSRCRTQAGLRVRNSNMFEAFTRESVEAYYRQAQRL